MFEQLASDRCTAGALWSVLFETSVRWCTLWLPPASDSFETLRTFELRQIAIESAERDMTRFARDLEHQTIRKS